MTAEIVVEIRRWRDKLTGKRYPQYRVKGGASLVWIPMGEFQARKALAEKRFLGYRVEEVFEDQPPPVAA